jgi:hypothetical protein
MSQQQSPIVYEFDVSDEYTFYPEPLSRQASFEALTVTKPTEGEPKDRGKLFDPQVRKQLQKLKPHYPWFMILVTVIQVGLMIYSMILNMQTTGTLIQMNPFNYMIGPESGVMIVLIRR